MNHSRVEPGQCQGFNDLAGWPGCRRTVDGTLSIAQRTRHLLDSGIHRKLKGIYTATHPACLIRLQVVVQFSGPAVGGHVQPDLRRRQMRSNNPIAAPDNIIQLVGSGTNCNEAEPEYVVVLCAPGAISEANDCGGLNWKLIFAV